jgi:hypothetical protein
VKVVLPIKKKRNVELTQKEKTYNKRHRRQRVIVEQYYLENKEVWHYGKQVQKQTEEV